MRAVLAACCLLTATLTAAELPVTPPPPLLGNAGERVEAVATDGHGFYVLTNNSAVLRGGSLDAVLTTFAGTAGAAAGSDDGYLVVTLNDGALTGWRVDTLGALLDRTPFSIVPRTAGPKTLAAAWDGARYVVAWTDASHDLYRTSVDRKDHAVGAAERIGTAFGAPAVAGRGGVSVVAAEGNALMAHSSATGSAQLGYSGSTSVAVAAGRSGFLVTWVAGKTLFAQRLDAEGRAVGSLLNPGFRPVSNVRVTSDGDGWLIAANDDWPGHPRGVRVSAGGAFGEPFDLVSSPGNAALVSDGSRTLVAYNASGLYTKFLDGAEVRPFDGARREQSMVSAAFDGVNYVVAWAEAGIRFGRISPRGRPLDGAGIFLAETSEPWAEPVEIAAGGGTSLVLWMDVGHTIDFLARRVDAGGNPSDPTPLRIASRCEGDLVDGHAVWDGSGFVVFVSCHDSLQAMRIGSAAMPSTVYPAGMHFQVARGDGRFLVVALTPFELRAFAVLDDLRLASPATMLLAPGEIPAGDPAIGFNGSEYLVTWVNTDHQAVARRVSLNGEPLGERIVVSDNVWSARVPARWDAGAWVLTWPYGLTFFSARVTPSGEVGAPAPVAHLTGYQMGWQWNEVAAPFPALFYTRYEPNGRTSRLFYQFEK